MGYIDSTFLHRCCCAQNFNGSQIPVTAGGFKLATPYMQWSYLTTDAEKLGRLGRDTSASSKV